MFPVPGAPSGTTVKIVSSTTRGLEVGELSKVIRGIGKRWTAIVNQLKPAGITSRW
jgi:hypothetical protein